MSVSNISNRNTTQISWTLILFYCVFVIFGTLNIYSASYNPSADSVLMIDLSSYGGKQLLFAGMSIAIIIVAMLLDLNTYERFSWLFYILAMILLIGLPFFGTEIKGNKSWYNLGIVALQPSEIAKFSTALALSSFLSGYTVNLNKITYQFIAALIIILPMGLILLQPDAGSAIVFMSFFIVLYISGAPVIYFVVGIILSGLFILDVFVQHFQVSPYYILGLVGGLGILLCSYAIYRKRAWLRMAMATVFILVAYSGIHFFVWESVFKDYQRQRILTSFKLVEDNKGVGFNTFQSEIAIGSGGLTGKGFLAGTQTKGNFVPEQHTDFIFSTLGEEWGFMGSSAIVVLYSAFLLMIIKVAKRQRTHFARTYAYCVFSLFFFHYVVNVAMALGLMPVIGIPLPFFSYGGSSLWSFTILLFILIKLDAHRKEFLVERDSEDKI